MRKKINQGKNLPKTFFQIHEPDLKKSLQVPTSYTHIP